MEIRLPDKLGQDLLTRFHNHDESVAVNHFEDYFKGIVIVPDVQQSYSLLSFQVSDSLSALVLLIILKEVMRITAIGLFAEYCHTI